MRGDLAKAFEAVNGPRKPVAVEVEVEETEPSTSDAAVEMAADELMAALETGDRKSVASALRSAFMACGAEPMGDED